MNAINSSPERPARTQNPQHNPQASDSLAIPG